MGLFHRLVKATKCVLMQPTAVTSRTPHSEQDALAGKSARTDSKQAPESIDSDTDSHGTSDSEGDSDSEGGSGGPD